MAVFPGMFVPINPVFDVTDLQGKDLSSPEFREFMVRLTLRIRDISQQLNAKDTGIYPLQETICSQVFFPDPALSSTTAQSPTDRQVFRKVVLFGPLPNTGATVVAHGMEIDARTSFTRIYGAATNPGVSYLPLPYAAVNPANAIELSVDPVNITITTGSNRSAYTIVYVILECIKQ